MKSPDKYRRIRSEFESTEKSLYRLAADYQVPYSTLWARSGREKWARYGSSVHSTETTPLNLEGRLKSILKLVLERLEEELNKPSSSNIVSSSTQSRLDTAFKTYLKLLDIQSKMETGKPSGPINKGEDHSLSSGKRGNRDALVKSLLRRLDVLRVSGETEIGNLLSHRD